MHEETVTVSKAKMEELEKKIDAMGEVAKECVQKTDRLIQIARGEDS